MGHLLLTLALALGDVRDMHRPVVETRFDVLETHHMYDDAGCKVFDQIIAWNFSYEFERFEVVAWKLWRPSRVIHCAESARAIIWVEGDVLRKLRFGSRRESWTQGHDPEMFDRGILPDDARKGWGKP